MTGPRSRRRFLAAAVPVALAGCLVEGEADATGEDRQSAGSEGSTDSDQTDGDEPAADTTDRNGDGSGPAASDENASHDDGDSLAEPAGISVAGTEIVRIVESINLLSQIVADVTVRNVGERAYGTLEFRVDAYYEPPDDDRTYHPPRVDERTAVGREYVERTFESFDGGTRTFEDLVVQYDAEDANGSVDPDEFDLEVAIRRADRT